MSFLTPEFLRWIGYAILVLSLAPFGLALRYFYKSRRAQYYAVRRAALMRTRVWFLVTLGTQLVGVIFLAVIPRLVVGPGPIATPSPSATPSPTCSPTSSPTRSPTATPTPRPTATPPFIPTATSDPAATGASPLPSPTPGGENARVELQAVALDVDDQGQPVDVGQEFAAGERRILVFFQYEGMEDGLETTFAWYRDGELYERCSDTWPWGIPEGRDWGLRGFTWYVCNPSGGWQPASYAVEVVVAGELQDRISFAIVEP